MLVVSRKRLKGERRIYSPHAVPEKRENGEKEERERASRKKSVDLGLGTESIAHMIAVQHGLFSSDVTYVIPVTSSRKSSMISLVTP